METVDPVLLRDVYHSILELGLENLERYNVPERYDYLHIEIEHLHNIPHYMDCDNVYAHAYYYCTERPYYLKRVATIPVIDTNFMVSRYSPYWDALRDALAPFADLVNAKHYTESL